MSAYVCRDEYQNLVVLIIVTFLGSPFGFVLVSSTTRGATVSTYYTDRCMAVTIQHQKNKNIFTIPSLEQFGSFLLNHHSSGLASGVPL